MKPTDILREEHRIIEKVLGAIEDEVMRLRGGGEFDADFFTKAVDFIRNFADGAHHAREEERLFPAIEKRGIPRDAGPIGCMLHEHEQGREFVRHLRDALDKAASGDAEGAVNAAVYGGSSYAALLRDHIYKEDNILYPMADEAMTPEDQAQLGAVFERIDSEFAANGNAGKYRRLAEELANR